MRPVLCAPKAFALALGAPIGQQAPGGSPGQAFTSAPLRCRIGGAASAFAEIFISTPETRNDRDQAGVQVGVMYVLTPSVAVDGAMLPSLAPNDARRAGVSVRSGR